MAMYRCPICNGAYTSIEGVEKCFTDCKIKMKEKEEKLAKAKAAEALKEQARKERLEKNMNLAKTKRKDIEELYDELMEYVDEYNELCENIKDDGGSANICVTTCSFFDSKKTTTDNKEKDNKYVYLNMNDSLDKLIKSYFGF